MPRRPRSASRRNITIQPNLLAWLKAYPLKEFPIIPANLQHIREKVALNFPLSHDVMRHTFISMFVAKFRSIGEAAIQAGNSEGIIRRHYLDLKSPEEAGSFSGFFPAPSPPRSTGKDKRNRVVCGLNAANPCLLRLTRKQGYGNTHNHHPHPKPAHRYNRPAPQRHFSHGQRAFDSHPARLDETSSHSSSPSGHFVYYDLAEVSAHIRTKLKVPARG